MVKLELIYYTVTSKGREYHYAWRPRRGDPKPPRLPGKPSSPEFKAALIEAQQNLRTPDKSRFRAIIADYRSTAFKQHAPSTRRNWSPWLDRIGQHFGELRIAQFDRPDKIRKVIIRWRSQWADKTRTADCGMHAVDPLGKIATNPCTGIKRLYEVDRSEIIWIDTDVLQVKAASSIEVGHVVDLAAHTGLRLGDLLRLSWSHIGDDAITITTGKSRHRRTAIIPLYDALRDVLARIPKRSTTVLTNERHRPWKTNGFGTAFNRSKHRANMQDRDLNFNDLRGTAVTKFYLADIPLRVIAEIVAWDEESVEKIIRRYVGRAAATKELIRRINERRT